MIRFEIIHGDSSILTPWIDEPVKYGQGVVHTAVAEIMKLRPQYPDAKIRIERTTVIPQPERKLFRYEIFVRDGLIPVVDGDGEHVRHISNASLKSRPFQEAERDKVVTEIKTRFPDALLKEVQL